MIRQEHGVDWASVNIGATCSFTGSARTILVKGSGGCVKFTTDSFQGFVAIISNSSDESELIQEQLAKCLQDGVNARIK